MLLFFSEVIMGNCVLGFGVLLGNKARCLLLSYQARACILECLQLRLMLLLHKPSFLFITSRGLNLYVLSPSFYRDDFKLLDLCSLLYMFLWNDMYRTSQFIIGLNKYLEAARCGFSVGMRFRMRFEGEDSPERRFTGTIVGVGDFSPQWSDSKWRSLKVQWDEPASIPRPERVSPWEIEPYVASASLELTPPAMKSKRPRPIDLPLAENTTSSAGAPFWYPSSTTPHELNHLGSTTEVQSHPEGIWPSSLNLFRDSTNDNKNVSARPNPLSDYNSPVSSRASNGHALDQQERAKKSEICTGYRLFGIDLRSSSNNNNLPPQEKELVGSKIVANNSTICPSPVNTPEADKVQNLDSSKSLKEKKQIPLEATQKEAQSKQGCTTLTRTRTKVQMRGVAVGRAVDLTALEGYDDLITELEKMFEIKGELRVRNKWEVVYTDDEGDMMLVGDDPWQEFCEMARKIFIYTSEEVRKMSPRSKLPLSSLEVEGTTASLDSELKSEA
ncbi:hypothetical protein LguiA_010499 [Lonicera macranthoides]